MALINCSECGREVSNKATTCPNCGAPVKYKNIYVSRPVQKLEPISKNTNYSNIRLGFGITNLSIGTLIFIAVLSSNGGIEKNTLQMSGAWFMFITGLITVIGRNKKGLIITSIVFYSFTVLILIAIMLTLSNFSFLAIMNIVFLILTCVSLSKDSKLK